MHRGRKCGHLTTIYRSHTEDLIEYNNPIFDTHVDQHDAIQCRTACVANIKATPAKRAHYKTGLQVVKQQWRPHRS